MRMRADIELPSEYQGRVVSRSKALKSANNGSSAKDDLKHDMSEDDAEESESEEETGEGESDQDGSEEEDEEKVEEDEDEDKEDGKDEGDDQRMRELEELEAEQQENVVKLVQMQGQDQEKAAHARNQRALSDAVLEARIRLQKPVALAARLPRGAAMRTFAQQSTGESLAPLMQECRTEARELVEQLLALRASLWSNTAALPNPGAWKTRGDDGGAGKRKREDDVEEVWGRVMGADSEIETFRDATIDKWNAKVMLGSGARNATKFKALNQSILTQVCVFGVRGCL